MLPDPEASFQNPIELAWLYSLHVKSLDVFSKQTFQERIETNFLFKMFPYAFTTNNANFLLHISQLLNLQDSVSFFCEIFYMNYVPVSKYYWTVEEDMFLFHLLIHAYINQQSLNVFFGKRSVDACIQRILYLKSVLINEELVDDYFYE